MINFERLEDFIDHLIHSIKSGKDTYVFNYTLDDSADYQFIEENDIMNYYVIYPFDMYWLEKYLSHKFLIDIPIEDIHITLDFYKDDECDELIERMFIFRSK